MTATNYRVAKYENHFGFQQTKILICIVYCNNLQLGFFFHSKRKK